MTTSSAPTDPAGNAGLGQAGTDLLSFSFFASPNREGISAPAPPPSAPVCQCQAADNVSSRAEDTSICVNIHPDSCALNVAPAAAGPADQEHGCCFFLSGGSGYFKRSCRVGFRDGVIVVQVLQCGFKLVISQAYLKHFCKIRRVNAFIFWG